MGDGWRVMGGEHREKHLNSVACGAHHPQPNPAQASARLEPQAAPLSDMLRFKPNKVRTSECVSVWACVCWAWPPGGRWPIRVWPPPTHKSTSTLHTYWSRGPCSPAFAALFLRSFFSTPQPFTLRCTLYPTSLLLSLASSSPSLSPQTLHPSDPHRHKPTTRRSSDQYHHQIFYSRVWILQLFVLRFTPTYHFFSPWFLFLSEGWEFYIERLTLFERNNFFFVIYIK